VLWAGGCSKKDADGDGYCAVYEQRARDCKLIGEGATSCVNYADAAESCETKCVAAASCSDLASFVCGGSFYQHEIDRCMGQCVGLAPVQCQDGRLLGGYARCTGFNDCAPDGAVDGDDSDERGCQLFGYHCRNATGTVEGNKVCDQQRDCPDGSDELPDCATVDSCEDFSGQTINVTLRMVCDGNEQCADGSDERVDCAPLLCAGLGG
jgi:hypothetical protein